MNRILFEPADVQSDGTVLLSDGRAEHLVHVLRAEPGQTVRTGMVDGPLGFSRVLAVEAKQVRLLPEHTERSPEPWFDLLLAAPRPKVLKRLWPQLAALGVGRIVVLNAFKVEKCYFSSQWLDEAVVRSLLIEGLMQGGLTRLPQVLIRPRFKPFVEDELDVRFPSPLRFLAHPGPRTPLAGREVAPSSHRPLLAIGPEGGWTDYEVRLLLEHGFRLFSLGKQTLRTDTACVALVSVLHYCGGSFFGS